MGRHQLPGKDAGDRLGVIQRDVDDEMRREERHHLTRQRLEGIVENPRPRRMRMRDQRGPMKVPHSLQPRDTGHQGLGSAGEASVEMGLDKTRGNAQIRLHPQPVQPTLPAARRGSHMDKIRGVLAVVIDHAESTRRLSQHPNHFLARGAPVSPCADQNRHACVRQAQLRRDPREQKMIGNGARVVGHCNDHLRLTRLGACFRQGPLRNLHQREGSDRIANRALEGGLSMLQRFWISGQKDCRIHPWNI